MRNVDKVQNDFLSAIKGGKLNHRIEVKEDLKDVQGKNILLFHIPEADRTKKPIYPNGDIRQSFIRRGGCNQRCTQEEIHRFLRDASSERWEGEIIDLPLDKAFDVEAIAWYRKKFQENTPGYTNGNDIDFLHEWGYLVSKDRRLYPTRASVLLFGSNMAYHQLLSKPVLDMQWIPAGMKD
ncbi:MAG: transcriptional regulator, partial [Candidatus Thermoplasmatota archaeon]|nr:transcriptional regulator [Candidatus Thermoplasmatota archaeon]